MIGHTPTLMWTQMDILQNTNSNDRVGRTVSRCFDHFPIWTLESCVNICLKKTDDTGNRRQWCHMLNVGYSRKYVVANLRVSVPLFLLFLMVKSTSKGEHESKSMYVGASSIEVLQILGIYVNQIQRSTFKIPSLKRTPKYPLPPLRNLLARSSHLG